MKKIIKKTFIHRDEKMPYLWTKVGVTLLSVLIVLLIVFAQYHQYIFLKINHKLSGLVIDSVVIDATNQQRESLGLGELKSNQKLKEAAQAKANDMASKGYFAHYSPDGKTPWYWIDQTGYKYKAAGENLAVNFDYSLDVVNAWMNSPTHKANIVKAKYTEIGIGVAEGFYQGRPTVYVVQLFGTPEDNSGSAIDTSLSLKVQKIQTVSVNGTSTASSSLSALASLSASTSAGISASTTKVAVNQTKVLGASVDTLSLYDLLFSGKIRTIVLGTIIILIILVLFLALLNPNGKIIVKVAKLALIPLTILLIAYIVLIMKAGTAEASFMEF